MSAPLRDEAGARPVAEHRHVYDGMVWSIARDTIDFAPGVRFDREYLEHTGAVAVLAVDDQDRLLLIRQYRHPAARTFWEIPAGLLDKEGEDPSSAASRELLEETGVVAGSLEHLVTTYPSPGGSSEAILVYLARDLQTEQSADFERRDEEAEIELRWVELPEVLEAIRAGDLTNGTLLTAVLAYAQLR